MGSVRVKISTPHNLVKTEVLSKIEKDSLLAESLLQENTFSTNHFTLLVSQIVTIIIFEEKKQNIDSFTNMFLLVSFSVWGTVSSAQV